MNPMALIIILTLAGLALIMMEIITPSFGLLGLCAAGCLIYAAFVCFTLSQWLGLGFVLACLLGVPAFLSVMMRILPDTRLGRWIVLRRVEAGHGEGVPERGANSLLIGREGVCETTLRPVGAVRIDGRRYIAMAEEGFLAAGASVRVLRLSGGNLVVRPSEGPEASTTPATPAPSAPSAPPATPATPDADTPIE